MYGVVCVRDRATRPLAKIHPVRIDVAGRPQWKGYLCEECLTFFEDFGDWEDELSYLRERVTVEAAGKVVWQGELSKQGIGDLMEWVASGRKVIKNVEGR